MSLTEGEKTLSLFLPISLRLSELSYDLDRKLELPFGFKMAISVETMVHCLRLQCGSGRRVLMRLVYKGQTPSWVNQEGASLVHSLKHRVTELLLCARYSSKHSRWRCELTPALPSSS